MPAVRDLGLPKRQSDRRALFHTVARRQTWGRPRGKALAEITSDHCQLKFLGSYGDTFAPGASVTGLTRFGLPGVQVVGKPAPGAGGSSSIAFSEETFTNAEPLIQAQVPNVLTIPVTQEIFLIGLNFKVDPVDLFQAVLFASEDASFFLDPFVTIDVAPVFVSDPASEGLTVLEGSTVVKLTITVAAGHPASIDAETASPNHFLYWRVTRS